MPNVVQFEHGVKVETEPGRDRDLTTFGRAVLDHCYLLRGESYQDLLARVATDFADDGAHTRRLYDAMSKHWFMPAMTG
jgi:ribonucleoside-diphosphate reductase alpha chain|tara:strand:- start:1264 stop:1500 length:237 start_codon:yes stop_codon:yes gene_type:complete